MPEQSHNPESGNNYRNANMRVSPRGKRIKNYDPVASPRGQRKLNLDEGETKFGNSLGVKKSTLDFGDDGEDDIKSEKDDN